LDSKLFGHGSHLVKPSRAILRVAGSIPAAVAGALSLLFHP